MNDTIYRKDLIRRIADMLASAEVSGELEHRGLKGRFREIGLQQIIESMLPTGVEVDTGIIVDSRGNQSAQIDLIIYSTRVLPRFFRRSEQVIVPIESCIQAIEVKSILTAHEVRDSINKAETVKGLFLMLTETNIRVPPIFTLFALRSDLTNEGKTEWERYIESKPPALKNHVTINDICVVGGGYWTSDTHVSPTSDFQEVISMLGMAANSVPHWINYRGTPVFGNYFKMSEASGN